MKCKSCDGTGFADGAVDYSLNGDGSATRANPDCGDCEGTGAVLPAAPTRAERLARVRSAIADAKRKLGML